MRDSGPSSNPQPAPDRRAAGGLQARLAVALAAAGTAAHDPAAAARPIRESRRSRSTLRRQAAYRRSLAIADMAAAGLALMVVLGALSSDDSLHLATLLALPLVVLAGKIQRAYERNELVLNKSTIAEAPKLFQLATFFTLLVFVLHEQLLTRRSAPAG